MPILHGVMRGPMDSAWLTDFLTLVETGSFSRAAEQRNLTQPAFSRRIRALEDWIGAPLFDRSIMPVSLTGPGRQFLPEARKLAIGIAEAQRLVRAADTTPTGLRLATTDVLAPAFLPNFLSAAEIDDDAGILDVAVGSEREGEAALARGDCHLLLCHCHNAAGGGTGGGTMQAVIARDLLLPVGSLTFAARYGDASSPSDMPLLAYGEDTLVEQVLRTTLAKRLTNRQLAPAFVSQSTALLHAMALRGRGMAWLPFSLVRDDVAAGRLAVLGDPSWREPVDIVLARGAAVGSQLLEAVWNRANSIDQRSFGLSEFA